MSNLTLTAEQVFTHTVNRAIDAGMIKNSQITASYVRWLDAYLPAGFLLDVMQEEGDKYDTLKSDYLQAIWAWGVIHDNFEYITLNITDKGIVQLIVEGTASLIGRDSRGDAKAEIKQVIYQLLKKCDAYCKAQEFAEYTGLKLQPALMQFHTGRQRTYVKY